MNVFQFLMLAVLCTVPALSNADNSPQRIPTNLEKIYAPEGFDDNDNIQIVGEGLFPNSCYRSTESTAKVDTAKNEILIQSYAYQYSGMCLQVILPFDVTFNVGVVKPGTYSVKQANSGKLLGSITVKASASAEPDDFLYAPVSQAYVSFFPDMVHVSISGEFPSSCMKIKDVQYQLQKDVLVVLPLVDVDRTNGCTNGSFPFTAGVSVPKVPAGRYLLHIRSMNGKAINTVFNAK